MPLANRGLDTPIFRIIHYRNLEFTLRNGLFCPNSPLVDPNYVNIGNQQIMHDRGNKRVPIVPNGVLNDYVPFYFAPRSPMLYSIIGPLMPQADIVYIVSNIRVIRVSEGQFVFTNRHAYVNYATFYNSIEYLDEIDWQIMNAEYWNNRPNDNDRMTRRMAEFLVYQFVPVNCILAIATNNQDKLDFVNNLVQDLNLTIETSIQRNWYY